VEFKSAKATLSYAPSPNLSQREKKQKTEAESRKLEVRDQRSENQRAVRGEQRGGDRVRIAD
jgi:hypothetical protein